MSHDPDFDEGLRRLLRMVVRYTFDPAELIAEEVRQPRRPRRAQSAPKRPEIKREPSNAAEAFSIVKAKQQRRKANTARKGIAPRPTAQMGWNRNTDRLIREVLRSAKKDELA